MTPRPRKANGQTSGYAVAYRRVSTEEQRESGLGLDAQTAAIEQAATRAGLELRDTFTDAGLSGALAIERRPGLTAALAALKRGDVLLVAKRDRIARDVMIVAVIEAAAKRKHARILSAAGEGTDGDSPADALMRMLIDAFSVYERLVIGARTAAALAAKTRRGERVSRHAPYGYRFTATTPARLDPEPSEQATIAIIRECREAAFSFAGTAAELNRLGHTTRSGSPWRWQYVRSAYQTAARHQPAPVADDQ